MYAVIASVCWSCARVLISDTDFEAAMRAGGVNSDARRGGMAM